MHSRRDLMRAALAAPLAAGVAPALVKGGLIGSARAAGPYKVGFMYVGPVEEAGYTFQHDLGRRAVDAKFGAKVKTTYVENVPEGADAERVVRKLAQSNELVFTTSFGFMNPTVKVAKEFPKVKFEHATGYKRAANLATYSGRFYEGRFLAGVIAGRMTKSNVLGFVGAFPIPEVVQNINAYAIGARMVNPKAVVKVVWVSTWYDPGKERAAADTLMSQGADVLVTHTDSAAVQEAGEQRGIWTIGYDSDMGRYGPKTCLTSVVSDWAGYYVQEVEAGMNGTWKSHDTWGGLKSGMVRMAPFNKALPQPVADEVTARQADIEAGKLAPFQGPLKDQAGATKVAAGARMADPEILGMNWLAEGVEGKLG
ncbi:MAG: BMP family ABC transporter substrate-binding protein [Rhodospirillales bacterium]|nr:BMP family ABC transporter substrate-binding protein [Rhodospirillales bacterium]